MKDIVKSQTNDEYKFINGKKVKVSRRKRRSNVMTYSALTVAAFTVIGLIVCLCFLFDLKEVTINGVTLYTNEQILAVGGVTKGSNLIRTNTDIIEQRLLDTLPYVEEVSVKKDYPNSLIIEIKEAEKCAEIENAGRYCILSRKGNVLEVDNPNRDTSLPLVIGFDIKEPKANYPVESNDAGKAKVLMQMIGDIEKSGLDKIGEINITNRTDLYLKYDGRIDIQLGSSLDMEYKLESVKAVIDNKLIDGYEGLLRYNGANSGISAIPKAALTTRRPEQVAPEAQPGESVTTLPPEQPQNQTTTTQPGQYTGWQ